MKVCCTCGEEKPITEYHFKNKAKGILQSKCKSCLYRYQVNRWHLTKIGAIEYKGGKCVDCGYNAHPAGLQFHHLDPNEKETNWNKTKEKSWDKITKELDKCVLLCAVCHTIRHASYDYVDGEIIYRE